MATTPRAPSKQERAYRAIRERIVDRTYGPGHPLVISAIARELDISPVPVREAIRRLEAEGWLVYEPNSGPRVAPTDERAWEETIAVLALLEGGATAIGAMRLTDQERLELRELHRRMQMAAEELDVGAFAQLNRAFHRLLYTRSDNGQLVRLIDEMRERLDSLRRTIFAIVPSRMRSSIEEHEALLRAIEEDAGGDEIYRLARDHKLQTIAAYRGARSGADLTSSVL